MPKRGVELSESELPSAFYVPVGGQRFTPTEATRGPWSAGAQHGGPPSALLGRAVRAALPDAFFVARFDVELLRPVPLGALRVEVEPPEGGRNALRIRARLIDDGGELCATALALGLRTAPFEAESAEGEGEEAPRSPEASRPTELPFFPFAMGYHRAVELRIAEGDWMQGAMTAHLRMRIPLVEGDSPSALERTLCAADSGSGIGAAADFREVGFINPDLHVHLHRALEGEWVGLAARTFLGEDGVGLTETALWDGRGRFGRVIQSLLLRRR